MWPFFDAYVNVFLVYILNCIKNRIKCLSLSKSQTWRRSIPLHTRLNSSPCRQGYDSRVNRLNWCSLSCSQCISSNHNYNFCKGIFFIYSRLLLFLLIDICTFKAFNVLLCSLDKYCKLHRIDIYSSKFIEF